MNYEMNDFDPITIPSRSEADQIADATEELLHGLLQKPSGLFTAHELAWMMRFGSKMRWGTSAEQEQKYLTSMRELKDRVEHRARHGFSEETEGVQ